MASLTAADFTPYNTADAGSIEAGPLALFTVPVASIMPTQQNEGFTEVDAKAAGYDQFTTLAEVENDLLGDVEPVVIGPNGQLYLLDGHHTFTALLDSVWGAQNPTVYVNVIANFSGLSQSEFLATMQSDEFLLPLNDGVPEPVSDLPTSLTGLTSDVYRGLEYSILKNKSSKLFTNTNNITGATGASTPGLDKMPGLYSDFFEAAAYQDADGGNGLPYLSPGDIALATRWNLNPDSATTLPNVSGTVFASQLPGFILSQNVVINGVVSNATMNESGTTGMSLVAAGESQTGALDGSGNGTFTGVTEINAGTLANPIWIGTPNTGFIMQLVNDKGFTATLSNTANTYVGGTTILAGRLIIASDGSLGAAPTETLAQFNNSLTFDTEGMLDNAGPAVQADNGIIFNSLSEGNGTLTIGTSADQYPSSSPFVTNRPIAVGNEAATIDVNGSTVDLDGPLVTLGYDELGIGETTGFPDLTIDDLSSGGGSTPTAGKLVLSIPSPDFYGDIIIGNTGTPTVEVMSDAALGNTTPIDGSTIPIGTVELNGGTLQTGASFAASERNITLDGGSQIDLDGNTTSWGTLTDVKRTIAIGNSNTTTAGAITFNNFVISQTAQLQLDGSADGTTYSGNETVAFTNGIQQTAPSDTLFIDPSSATALGTATEKLFSSGASTTLVNGMAPAWIITDSGGGASTNPYNFVTYGANGYVNVTYTDTGSGSMGGIRTATSTSIVDQTGNATLAANAAAYALKVNDGAVITATGFTITIGDGTAADAAGLILGGGSAAITGGTLAFGGSQGIIYVKGTTTVTSEITGTNGLTIAGSGTLQLNSAAPLTGLSGAITIDSGELSLGTANLFQSDVAGLTLDDVKSHPSNSILNFTASQTFTTLNSVGTKSAITFSDGATLTIGDTTNNLSSTLSSSITESGVATAGALTINGTGLTDLSGMSGGTLSLVSGSTIVVENGAQLRVTASEFANGNFGISLGNGTQLQFAQNGGGQFANAITGSGELHLIGGTLQLTETAGANTYTGGTVVETGSTLDLTTSQVSTGNANITDAGGLIVFDQDFGGTYAGIISDGKEMGTGPMLSGSLDIDDSAADSASDNNVTLTAVQGYSGATYVEAGTLTLGVANAIADSSGVTLGRVGGAVSGIVGGASSGPTYTQTANLVLEANQQLKSLSSDAGNATTVTLNGNTLTLTPGSGIDSNYSGVIADGSGSGSVVADGAGTVTFGGDNTFSGGVTIDEGVFELANAGAAGTGAITFAANADATLKIDLGDEPTGAGNTVDGFKIGDSIDFAGVGLETGYTYSGGVLTLTGGSSSAQIDLAAPPSGQFFVLSSDGSGGTVVTLDSTVPTESVGGPYTGNEGVAIPLNLSVTATPNTGDSLSTTVSAGDGTITVGTTGGASISNNGSGSVTLAGTAAQINTALGNASYTGDSGFYGSDTLSMTATDTTDGQSSPTDTVGITVNDTTAPGESLHGPYSGNENTPIALNLSVSASPTVTDPLSTTLSVSNGIVSADGQTGSSITLTGTAAQIDTALQAASYTGNSNFYGSDTLSMTTTDTADNQTTGAETAGITVNDTATIADTGVTGGFSGNENTAISLASVHISDSNTGDTSLVTTLSVSDGTITVGTTAGGAAVGTNGTGTVTLTGTAAQIDASLQNSSYTGDSNFYGNDTLSVTSTDGGSQTSGPSQGRITVNDTTVPTESVGGPYGGNENTAIALNLSVSASPNTSDPLSTTLSVLNGTVSADGQTGSSITLTGTAAQINTALGGASYTGNTNFYGNDTLSMTTTDTEDNQSTGAEAAGVTVADTATISETGVTGGFSGNENTAISLASVQVSDTNTNDNTLVTTLSVNDGTVSVGTTAGGAAVGNNGTGTVTLSGTTAEIDASLKNTSYTGNSNFHGQDMLSVTSTDHGGRIS
ncbi:MAG TPA: ParB-like protein, partial [Stellaceae bacterium]|nr:ParB-like protein [Stellaceae bacterium]